MKKGLGNKKRCQKRICKKVKKKKCQKGICKKLKKVSKRNMQETEKGVSKE